MSNTIRAFIAIELPNGVLASIQEMQNHLKTFGFKVRWVRPENIHLTLKFLGSIKVEDVEKIGGATTTAAMGVGPFSLEVKGLGVFPDIHRPRVLWAGIAGETPPLNELQKDLEEALRQVGVPKEKRPFSGHLTLGRVKGKIDSEKILNALKLGKAFISDPFTVRNLYLIKSDLKPTGAEYTKLIQAPLANLRASS